MRALRPAILFALSGGLRCGALDRLRLLVGCLHFPLEEHDEGLILLSKGAEHHRLSRRVVVLH
jgi:hypothetical protein